MFDIIICMINKHNFNIVDSLVFDLLIKAN